MQFEWNSAWGGVCRSSSPPLIHAAMLELRRKVGNLQATKKGGVPYPVKSAKDLMTKLRDALDDLALDAKVVHQAVQNLPSPIPSLNKKTEKTCKRTEKSGDAGDPDKHGRASVLETEDEVGEENEFDFRYAIICHIVSVIRVIAMDGSFVEFVGSGHGAGFDDDKVGGKASTYAWKDGWIKGLNLPDEEMVDTDDEVPAPKGKK